MAKFKKPVRRTQSKLTLDKICQEKNDNFQKKVCSKHKLNFESSFKRKKKKKTLQIDD